MKIVKIDIRNYKSIKELSIPFDEDYGDSKAVFLLGINESGKSNILEALNQISEKFQAMKFDNTCYKFAQEEEESDTEILAWIKMEESDIRALKNKIVDKFECFKNSIDQLNIQDTFLINTFLNKNSTVGVAISFILEIDDSFPFHKWRVEGDDIIPVNEKETSDSTHISKEDLIEKVKEYLRQLISNIEWHTVVYWKPDASYLINEPISLTAFRDDWTISIPLKNMFYIYGKTTKEEITETIDNVLRNDEKKSEFQEKLSDTVTAHINSIWKEHKICIRIGMDGELLKVHVEDKDKKHSFYKMDQRSDGFKQFVSLLLTLSAQYKGEILKDNIILLDEPDAHLHPSGIKFMRDEILKIGKDNHIFVATHSPSMVDTNTVERHWIVTKREMETHVQHLKKGEKQWREQILIDAFGTDMLSDLLSNNFILVEGDLDKELLEYVIRNSKTKLEVEITIRSVGGVSKLYPIVKLLDKKNKNAYILCDSDREGSKFTRQLKEQLNSNFNDKNVFTLKDLEKNLPDNATIEDTLPRDLVIDFFRENGCIVDSLPEKGPILFLLNRVNENFRENKGKLNQLKRGLIDEFINKKSTNGYIFSIAEKLIEKINKHA